MTLPTGLHIEIEREFGEIRGATAVGGGCIANATRVETGSGPVFIKYQEDAPPGLFAAEARGLELLDDAPHDLRVPGVLALHDPADAAPYYGKVDRISGSSEPRWIALEWLEPANPAAGYWERLGRGLAALHRSSAKSWGATEDGFIGAVPQSNRENADWPAFWRSERLEPLLRKSHDLGRQPGSSSTWDKLFSQLPDLLGPASEDGPSLVHGDLWSGNVMCVENGTPALIDPAAYYGHREVDLAMAELFGGFDSRFIAAYRESWPLQPGYEGVRRGVYQLYYLLVHVILFGGTYGARTESVLRSVV